MLPDHPIITSEEGSDETKQLIGLQQQIARLEALLESSRQIHGTIHLNDVLSAILTIAVRELDPTVHLALKHDQLTSERSVLSLKPADRPERRNQQPQKEEEQRGHRG